VVTHLVLEMMIKGLMGQLVVHAGEKGTSYGARLATSRLASGSWASPPTM
jgi:hypothetical protein